jgi:hypothetical protein
MDHIKVLKRAFHITWNYKALWIFGIILALTVVNSTSINGPNQTQYTADETDLQRYEGIPESIELPDGTEVDVPPILQEKSTWITIGAVALGLCGICCCLGLIWIIAGTVLRYVAETALIRMVDEYEETGKKRSVREGFRMGWSHRSLRLFLIDLLFFFAGVAAVILLLILMAPSVGLSVWMFTQGVIALGIIGSVAAAGLFFLFVLFSILIGLAVGFVKPFFQRACVLEDLGVVDSLLQGLNTVKRHFAWDVVLMWLLVVGLNIAWFIAMFFVGLLLLFASLIVAIIPALVVGSLTGLILGWIGGLIIGGIVGGLIFVILLIASTTFLKGLRMTFLSTLWTLTYRELRALEGIQMKPEALDTPGLD